MNANLRDWDVLKLAVGIIAGGLLGFVLTVGFYAIRQRQQDRYAAKLAEEFGNSYEWKRVDGKMTVVALYDDEEDTP